MDFLFSHEISYDQLMLNEDYNATLSLAVNNDYKRQ